MTSVLAVTVLVRFCGGSSPMAVAEETNIPSPSLGEVSFSSDPSAFLALAAAKARKIEPRADVGMVPDANSRCATEESRTLDRFRPVDRFCMADSKLSIDLQKHVVSCVHYLRTAVKPWLRREAG